MVLAHNINEGIRTRDVQISEDVTFETMLLSPDTLEGLSNCGFYKPSPIQLHGIPLGKCGFDLLLEAKSGTGKTAVFTVVALEKLVMEKGLQTIILAPTREIAAQICDVISQIGSNYKNLNVEVVIGGLPLHEDVMKLKNKVQIVVGSPGRLRHLIQANHIDVTAVRLLVLDEADKLMDKSFQADINYIFSVLPTEKQVIMSSATYPESLKSVMSKYVKNAQHICPNSTMVLLGINQLVSVVKSNSNIVRQTQNRFEELLKILSKKNFKQCLIFCNYQVRVRDLYKMLLREKWPAEKLHGQQEQTDRLDALKMLQQYKCRILISTDLAARGIDASNIDLIVNFEPPYEWQTYLHRIGRAGRFGSYGTAVTILSEGEEETKFKKMIKSINESFDLKNFWDEVKLDLSESDSSTDSLVYQELEKNDLYHELINKLTHGIAKCDVETESFEALCNSFQESKECEVESFNDLLASFKLHKENNREGSSHNNFDAKCNNESNSNEECLLNNALLKLNINTKIEEDIKKLRKLLEGSENLKKNAELSKSYKELDLHNKTVNGVHKLKEKLQEINNVENELYDLELDESALKKALLNAGLPTSFCSSKDKIKPKKIGSTHLYNYESNQKSQTSEKIKYKETGNRNKPLPKENKSLYGNLEHETCSSGWETDSSSGEFISKDTKKEAKLKKSMRNESKTNYNYDNHGRRKNQTHDHEAETNCDAEYVNWYYKLKMHIRQIEMALYIDELSKL